MAMLMSTRGRVKLAFVLVLLPLLVAAAIYFGQKTGLAWDAPSVSITAPASGADVSGVVTVSATFSVNNGNLHEAHLFIDGDVVHTAPASGRKGSYSHAWDSSTVEPGPHTITVRAYTAAAPSDHFGETSIIVNVNYIPPQDTEAPIISVESPSPNEVFNSLPVNLLADLSDNTAIDTNTVVVKLDGSNITSLCAVLSSSVSCPVSPADGAHTVTIDAKDTGGNSATQKLVQFIIDTTPPALSVTSPPDGQVVIVPVADVSGTVSDAVSGISSVTVNGEAATLNGNSFVYRNLSLTEGANAITVTATDKAGNPAQQIITVTYTPPVCSSAANCDDGNALTFDSCANPGTVQAACAHDPIACNTAMDCNDDNALTLDTCSNPGQANSACANIPVACNAGAD